MIKFKLINFAIILKTNLISLSFIDIIIFSFFINTNYFFSFPEIIKISISIFLIQQTLLNYKYTEFLEYIFFISGAKVKKLILINFFINNLFFLSISFFLKTIEMTTVQAISENFFILNSLILISFLLKFIIPTHYIKHSFFRKVINIILFYFLFGLVSIGLGFPVIGSILVLIIFVTLINIFNRTLNLDDNN